MTQWPGGRVSITRLCTLRPPWPAHVVTAGSVLETQLANPRPGCNMRRSLVRCPALCKLSPHHFPLLQLSDAEQFRILFGKTQRILVGVEPLIGHWICWRLITTSVQWWHKVVKCLYAIIYSWTQWGLQKVRKVCPRPVIVLISGLRKYLRWMIHKTSDGNVNSK